MKTIISFVSILVAIIVIISGCTPGSIANLGVSLIDSHMKARAEDAKARRQAKYIAEEMRDKPTKKDFKTPDRIVRIDQASEVYMYNMSEGKIELLAFINNELQSTGSGNKAEGNKPDEPLRKEFINLFPCYAHLRATPVAPQTPIMEANALDLRPKEVATSFGTLKLGKDGDTLEVITKKMGQEPSFQKIAQKGNSEEDTDSVAVFYKDGNTFVFGLYGGKTVLYAEKTGILSLKDALASIHP